MFSFLRRVFLLGIVAGLFFFAINFSKEDFSINGLIQHFRQFWSGVAVFYSGSGKQNVLFGGNDESDDQNEEVEFDGSEDDLIVLINKERFDRGLKPYKKNELLMQSALEKARDMVRGRYFDHVSKFGGVQPWYFAEQAGYRYKIFGENIAVDYFSTNSVHWALMDSEGHKQNILSEDFRDIGVAIVPMEFDGRKNFVVVEHFGSYLRDLDLSGELCRTKNKQRCAVQVKKRKELDEMLKNIKRKKVEFDDDERDRVIERADNLLKIREQIDEYLQDCDKIKKECK